MFQTDNRRMIGQDTEYPGWINEQGFRTEVSAYERFIKQLQPKLDDVEILLGQKLTKDLFIDLISGVPKIKELMMSAIDKFKKTENDPDFVDFKIGKVLERVKRMESIAAEVNAMMTVKMSHTDYIVIDNAIISINKGVVSFDQDQIMEKHTARIRTELQKTVYDKAVELMEQINQFNEFVSGLNVVDSLGARYSGIKPWGESKQVIMLNDDASAEINPEAILIMESINPA